MKNMTESNRIRNMPYEIHDIDEGLNSRLIDDEHGLRLYLSIWPEETWDPQNAAGQKVKFVIYPQPEAGGFIVNKAHEAKWPTQREFYYTYNFLEIVDSPLGRLENNRCTPLIPYPGGKGQAFADLCEFTKLLTPGFALTGCSPKVDYLRNALLNMKFDPYKTLGRRDVLANLSINRKTFNDEHTSIDFNILKMFSYYDRESWCALAKSKSPETLGKPILFNIQGQWERSFTPLIFDNFDLAFNSLRFHGLYPDLSDKPRDMDIYSFVEDKIRQNEYLRIIPFEKMRQYPRPEPEDLTPLESGMSLGV